MEKISWWEVYASEDVDTAVDIFTSRLTDILDKMAPVKKFQMRTKYAAWLSESTKSKIKERDRVGNKMFNPSHHAGHSILQQQL